MRDVGLKGMNIIPSSNTYEFSCFLQLCQYKVDNWKKETILPIKLVKNTVSVLTSAAHILKLEQYRED